MKLNGGFGPVAVNYFYQPAQSGQEAVIADAELAGKSMSLLVHKSSFHDNKRGTAAGTGFVIAKGTFGDVTVVITVSSHHGRHNNSVFELHPAQLKTFPEKSFWHGGCLLTG